MKKSIIPAGLPTQHFAIHNEQRGYDESTLGTRTFIQTEPTQGQAPQLGHFGVNDRYLTSGDYAATPGWQEDGWKPLWDEPWVKEATVKSNFQTFQGPHSALEMSKFNNWGTYNNKGAPNVHPSTKPVPVDRVIAHPKLNTVRYF